MCQNELIIRTEQATASIDLRTALLIQRILKEELVGSTIITIAHRVEAAEYAQRYIRLGKGRVIAEGNVGSNRR